jgi:hypothetical protein
MTTFTSRTVIAALAAGTLLQGCAAVTTGWQAAPPVQDRLVVDPACLATAPWFVNPAEADLQLYGCRPAAAIPAADANGWREFTSADGALLRARGDTTDPRTGKVRVEVLYNGGGTLTVRSLLTGSPDAKGVLKAGTFTVTPLN